MAVVQLEGPLPPPVVVPVDYRLLLKLRQEAAKRDLSVGRLVGDLLEAIAADNLTAAVLDAPPSRPRRQGARR